MPNVAKHSLVTDVHTKGGLLELLSQLKIVLVTGATKLPNSGYDMFSLSKKVKNDEDERSQQKSKIPKDEWIKNDKVQPNSFLRRGDLKTSRSMKIGRKKEEG